MSDRLTELDTFDPRKETPAELVEANKELHEIHLGLQRAIALVKRDLEEKARRENQ